MTPEQITKLLEAVSRLQDEVRELCERVDMLEGAGETVDGGCRAEVDELTRRVARLEARR